MDEATISKKLFAFIGFKPSTGWSTIIGSAFHLLDLNYGKYVKLIDSSESGVNTLNKMYAASTVSILWGLCDNIQENSRVILREYVEEGHCSSWTCWLNSCYLGLNAVMFWNQFHIVKEFIFDPSIKVIIREAEIQVEAIPNLPEADVQPSVEAYAVEHTGNDVRPHID